MSVAHHHADAIDGHIQLIGDDLRDGGVDALPHVHLAEEGGDPPCRVDGDPGVELFRRDVAHGGSDRAGLLRLGFGKTQQRCTAGGHQQQTRALQELAPIQRVRRGAHACPVVAAPAVLRICAAARSTARRMAMCMPQRHFRPASSWRIWSFVGAELRSSSATTFITQALVQ